MAASGVTDLVGRVLAGRYRLLAPIGTGASGRVYVADDVRLRRRVAVKVLHAALAEDAGFLRRFRAEAQVAASLHHRNIVTVHDWGEDAVPFMVLEMLEGGSLRAMLDRGSRLTPAQAARIGRDVASALEYAHARGIVHRDIKPANLLFDEHAIVRVGDFGLARALAEASWTEPQGAVLGTARYASPEQALGIPLDARSDLYALALVLVEAVTGKVPFAADTTLGTLAARTQRPVHAPAEMGALAAVIERAGRIEPDERYPDAATMGDALAAAAEVLPPPGPLVLAGASDEPDPHPTRAVARADTTRLFDQDAAEPTRPVAAAAPPRRLRAGRRRLVPFVVAAVVAATLAAGGIALARVGGPATEVPGLVGRTEADARDIAGSAGLDLDVTSRREADDPEGVVVEQHPGPGSWLRGSDAVRVVVSAGPEPVAVPRLTGRPAEAALRALRRAGLVATVRHTYHEEAPAGQVLSQDPAPGSEVAPDARITFVLSEGPAPRVIPAVAGATFAEAEAALAGVQLRAARTEEFSNDVDEGRVVRTDPPEGGEVPRDSVVTVVVSRGPDLVTVPNVVGMTVEDASDALAAAGLEADVDRFRPGRRVRSQDPEAGRRVLRGETVALDL